MIRATCRECERSVVVEDKDHVPNLCPGCGARGSFKDIEILVNKRKARGK